MMLDANRQKSLSNRPVGVAPICHRGGDASVTQGRRQCHPNTTSETKPDRTETPVSPKIPPLGEAQEALNYYKSMASQHGWSVAENLTGMRTQKIRQRVKSVDGLSGWCDVIDRIPKSRFLMGKVEGRDGRAFKMHLDFVLQESSFTKLREGFYDDPDPTPSKFRPL